MYWNHIVHVNIDEARTTMQRVQIQKYTQDNCRLCFFSLYLLIQIMLVISQPFSHPVRYTPPQLNKGKWQPFWRRHFYIHSFDEIYCTPIKISPWWRHQMETFSELLANCAGNSPVPVNFPHKGQWRGALMFALICVWINAWVNNRKAGDLRRYCAHYDVIVMSLFEIIAWPETDNIPSPESMMI